MIGVTPLQVVLAIAVVASVVALLTPDAGEPNPAQVSERGRTAAMASAIDVPTAIQAARAGQRPEDFRRIANERPVFSRTRRPQEPARSAPEPVPVQQAAGPPPPETPPITAGARLVGIALHQDEAIALVQLSGSPRAVRVRERDTIEGWLVERINRDRVVLRSGQRLDELRFRVRPGQRAGP